MPGTSNGYLSGADLANLFVPGLAASWEQDVYIGAGAVLAAALAVLGLAVACLRGRAAGAAAFVRRHRVWAVSGAVILVLDAVAAMGNTVTLGRPNARYRAHPAAAYGCMGDVFLLRAAGLAAGLLLALCAGGAILRSFGPRAAAAALAVCTLVQGWGLREELGNRFAQYHDDATYADQTRLTAPAWEQLAQSGRFAHLAFASFDFEHPEFWDLAAFAADHGWTSNSFYMGHMDGNLAP